MRTGRKYVCLLTIIALLLTMLPFGIVQAQSAQYSPFHDVPTNHWALPHIIKSELRGVVTGYGNGIFKPDQTVTQLEAIVMAVRAMGLENETHNTNQFADTSNYDLPTTWNARGFVSVAIKHSLIDEQTFRPSAGASRAWTAQLLIRMLKMENELNMIASTPFEDDNYIPVWAKPYVALAVDKNIISGIPNLSGSYDYRPNDAVTRAQLSTLISRSDRYMNDVSGQLPIGIVKKIEGNTLTILKPDNTTESDARVTNTTAIYDQSYSYISQNKITVEDAIRYQLSSSGNLRYIELIDKNYYDNLPVIEKVNRLQGTLVQLYQEQRLMIVEQEDGRLYTGTYATDAEIEDLEQGRSISDSNLHIGDELELILGDNDIVGIKVIKSSQEAVLSGVIFAIDIERGILTLENNNRYTSYTFDDSVSVEYNNIRFATVRDLRKGDEIQIQTEDNKISKITLITPYQSNEYQGTIVTISVRDEVITIITAESDPVAYRTNSQTEYKINNVNNPKLSDLEIGDHVIFTVDGRVIKKLEVINRNLQDEIRGKLLNINKDLKMITIETLDEEYKTFKYDDLLDVYIDGNKDGRLDDLLLDTNIAIKIDKNTIIRITVNNQIAGTIVGLDKNRNTMTVEHDNRTTTYELSNNVEVRMQDIRRAIVEDIKLGMEMVAKLERNKIIRIDIKYKYSSIVKTINTDWDRIEVIDPDNSNDTIRYYVYEDVVIIFPGIEDPELADIRVDDVVELTFTGYELSEIRVVPASIGNITSIEASTNEIVVRNRNEVERILINNNLNIYSANGNQISAPNLNTNDFVRVQRIGDKTNVYLSSTQEVEFFSALGNRIYYYDNNGNYRNLALDREALIWQSNTFFLPGDIQQGAKISLYTFNNRVLGIRIH
ncbi:S-layer homology domain-containing protein [Desulfuribacillus alkaliarsenatis]|nr:S-layer homology domain-containing protein [Desulfuribacillus alkaliarsenatis]